MKLRNLFLASVACAGLFTACSNEMDEVIDNGNKETNNGEVAYASFAYTLPNGSGAKTRAQAAEGTEIGTDKENAVNEIAFVLFNKADGTFNKREIIARANFTPDTSTGSSTTYKTKSPFLVAANKEQHVFVIVNPSAAVKTYDGTLVDFQKSSEASFKSGEYFTMSNASEIATYTINPVANNTISNPVELTVPVERMVARIDYTVAKPDNKYDVISATGDKVQFTNYRVVNQRTNAFLLKRVGTAASAVIGAPEAENSYVIDPIFAAKSTADFFTSAAYTSGYSSKLAETTLPYSALPTVTTPALAYCHENTMEVAAQKNGAATGLVLKAKYTPKFETAGKDGDFYRYNANLYPSLKAMYDALNPEWKASGKKADIRVDVLGFVKNDEDDFAKFAATFTFATLKEKYVDLYAGGICYYSTFLRHISNNDNQNMSVMEYAIVRNNIYKLSINSVNKLGDPVAPIDPETPVETADTYLNVTVNVLDWTTRDNAVDL